MRLPQRLLRPMSRLQRFLNFTDPYLGRCPRLLHFAPLALRPKVLVQSLPALVKTTVLLSLTVTDRNVCPTYSYRSDTTGSTFVARLPGM